jgi:predicted SAM-dependent methyltransferase
MRQRVFVAVNWNPQVWKEITMSLLPIARRFAWSRPLSSYSKVQRGWGAIVRNRATQLSSQRIKTLKYLDIGCGPNTNPDLINMDFAWLPGVDLCWDITRGLPFNGASLKGIFSEHCLEHFPLKMALSILLDCHRVLQPGGVIRVVVPDAEVYLRTYVRRLDGDESARFPMEGQCNFEGIRSPVLDVNRIFYQDRESNFGHWFIYDFKFLSQILDIAGFKEIKRVAFRKGRNPTLLIDNEKRMAESLYVEAIKPE